MFRQFINIKPFASDAALFVLRVSFGLLLMRHGWDKLSTYSENANTFPDPLGVGNSFSLILTIFSEFFCSVLIALGLFTRPALLTLIITFLVIVMMIHGSDPLGDKEHGLMYLFAFVALFMTGPGKYSADALIRK
jgi:putative oxidoreductase